VRGGGGIFDVWVDGKRVFSKLETHAFPDEDALVAALQTTR
jgi:selT/selW/selH-like putative selenoprotein